MPIVVEDLLKPISEDKPSGDYLKYKKDDKVYADILEARREEADLNQGAWKAEIKTADYIKVVSLSTAALKNKTKDVQIGAWLTHALLKKESFGGFASGLKLMHDLLEKFWDTVYPQPDEDGDLGLRVVPLSWLGRPDDIVLPIRLAPLNQANHNSVQYNESRTVLPEDQAKTPDQKKKRAADLKEGKLPPEEFDKSLNETPSAFYIKTDADLTACLANLEALGAFCDEKFTNVDDPPNYNDVKTALTEVHHLVRNLAKKKGLDLAPKKEPEPTQPTEPGPDGAPGAQPGAPDGVAGPQYSMTAGPGITFQLESTESPARRALVEEVAKAAAAIRYNEPSNPAPYLMMRGLRWGDLRAAHALSDSTMLEAPPTEVRQKIKSLSQGEKWKQLLETAETLMAHPCSRAWLDLQRFVVESCVALGDQYETIAVAIRTELRSLLRDVPQLLDATLNDDTPAANDKTKEWLRSILAEPGGATPAPSSAPLDEPPPQRWQKRFTDSYDLAKAALKDNKPEEAIYIMSQEIARQRSGRGRFQRRIQFIDVCVSAKQEAMVQSMLDELIAEIDARKLEEWEDKSYLASALVTIIKASAKIQKAEAEKAKYRDRVCKLDPAQALNC